jgi:hypothetical protein
VTVDLETESLRMDNRNMTSSSPSSSLLQMGLNEAWPCVKRKST